MTTNLFSLSYIDALGDLYQSKTPFVQITLVEARGSTPNDQGAKALVTQTGLVWGTVGGGKVEAKALETASQMLHGKNQDNSKHFFVTWNLQKDVGMTCGGEVKLFFETHQLKPWTLAVFGAGHVAQKLVPILTELEAQVVVVDPRNEWMEKFPRKTNLTLKVDSEPARLVAQLPQDTYFILMSQGHKTDVPVLLEILKRENPPPFIGVIGSENKRLIMRRELKELGISDEKKLDSFFCPIGLQIGTSNPAEIAVSVAAQLLQIHDEKLKAR